MTKLNDSINKLHLVNAPSEKALGRLGIKTLEDLIYHFPRDWQDLREIKNISQIKPGELISIKAKVRGIKQRSAHWRKISIIETLLEDDSGNVVAVWFNQPFLKNRLIQGNEYYFHGKGQIYNSRNTKTVNLQLANPSFEEVKEDTIHTAAIIPHYDLTAGISQKMIRYWMKQALPAIQYLNDHLPEDIKSRHKLIDLKEAIQNIHFPKNKQQIIQARKRLAFDELFLLQLTFLSYKQALKNYPAPPIAFDKTLIQKFVKSLPFILTNSQRLSAWEILQDMEKPYPMNRLLEGDVGSGKTVVAGIAMLQVAMKNWQSILLAPTEILALQHHETLKTLFKNHETTIALMTRNHKTTNPEKIKNGEIKIIIGTHALLQENIEFQRIGLLVIDEQHRFGVKQRSKLQETKHGVVPHLLSMTATPIPRTLALAFYGDLDISYLKELPRGRKKIITRLINQKNRVQAYEFIKEKITQDRQQIYVVTPLIEESDKLGVRSVTQEKINLQKVFPNLQIAALHGKIKGDEKKQIMEDFSAKGGSASGGKSHQIDILVSTTVIEVGVDVPNATIMLIENAERFGLAQLHQLRGRVGRSDKQSYCFIFSQIKNEITQRRLSALEKSTNGFDLAELDLKLRGPGEIMGTKQSGYIPLKIASLKDKAIIQAARSEAEHIISSTKNNLDSYPELKKRVSTIAKTAHLE